MMDNDSIIRCTRDILDECFTNLISGIWPSDDVDDIGLWFCQMAGEVLTSGFLTSDSMTIEDAIEVGKKLTHLIAFDGKSKENYKLEFQEYYHLKDDLELSPEDKKDMFSFAELLSQNSADAQKSIYAQIPPSNNGSFSNG